MPGCVASICGVVPEVWTTAGSLGGLVIGQLLELTGPGVPVVTGGG